ncbi:MAG: CvpA family protein [Bacteroidota bacterium]
MTLDFLFLLPLIVFAALGFRDGMFRKLVAIVCVIGAMFAAQYFQQDLAKVLRREFAVDPADAPAQAYYFIFIGIVLVQSLLYRLLAKGYKVGGIADRIIGSGLGLFEGMLIISVILVMFSLQGIPNRKLVRESRLYTLLIGIAPRITDIAATAMPDAQKSLKELTTPESWKPKGETSQEDTSLDDMSEDERFLRQVEKNVKSSNAAFDSATRALKRPQ